MTLERIQDRLDAVEDFAFRTTERTKLRDTLKGMHDLERLMARLSLGTGGLTKNDGGKLTVVSNTYTGITTINGGILSTDGNLVFQGRGNGELWVYAADSGKVLKVLDTGSHIMAAPSTYTVGGEQYVAVQVGYGGAAITVGPIPASSAASRDARSPKS